MPRVAILIDGDNVSSTHARYVARLGKATGRVDVHRAYVNALSSSWAKIPGVEPLHAGTGKNASDLLLSIDAMELALTGWFDSFILVSSDGDFTHLANRLRAHGSGVIGVGYTNTPEEFQLACSKFHHIAPPQPAPSLRCPQGDTADLDSSIAALIHQFADEDGSVLLSRLGAKLRATCPVSTPPGFKLMEHLRDNPGRYRLDQEKHHERVSLV